jgi:hypothetical protein
MKEEILSNLGNPRQLEKLYRTDKSMFRQAFQALYPDLEDTTMVSFWHERLNFAQEETSWTISKDLIFVLLASLVAGLIAKLPAMFHLNNEFFYSRNIGFIIFPVLTAFFAWKNKAVTGQIIFMAATMLLGLVFINSLPTADRSDTLVLSCIHLLLFLWCILGYSFTAGQQNSIVRRLAYLKYNGDLVVITTLIVIAGGIMTGITIGLFSLIGFHIEDFYFDNIVVFGLPAAPILGTYLTQHNPTLVGRVSPVIARLFSPLVLVMLVLYLAAIVYSGKNPYSDRDFLLIFNALLVGVMAIIFFSIAENSKSNKSKAEIWILFLLSVVTVLVNGIALSAIMFRISEWGITPNRAAVLGGNVLILINLLFVTVQLYRGLSKKCDITGVGSAIATYLPVYFIWTFVVIFLFPFLFGFK